GGPGDALGDGRAGPGGGGLRGGVRRAAGGWAHVRGGELGDLGVAPGAAGGRDRAGGRGDRALVHVRGDGQRGGADGGQAGVRRHQRGHVQPGPGGGAGGGVRPDRGGDAGAPVRAPGGHGGAGAGGGRARAGPVRGRRAGARRVLPRGAGGLLRGVRDVLVVPDEEHDLRGGRDGRVRGRGDRPG